MGKVFGFALLMVIIGLGLGYLSKGTSPDEHDYPLRVKVVYTLARLFDILGRINEWFGGSYWTFYKINAVNNATVDNIKSEVRNMRGVEVTIIQPADYHKKEAGAAIIYFHGGGWSFGSPASFLTYLKTLARDMDILIASPDYRLAPEFPFPIPFQDSLRVTEEFMKEAPSYNVNPNKVILSGDSAGGNLAMAVSLALIDQRNLKQEQNHSQVCILHMINPALQMTDFSLPSHLQNPNPPLWSLTQLVRSYISYMGFQKNPELVELLLNNAHMSNYEKKDESTHYWINEDFIPDQYKIRSSRKAEISSAKLSTRQKEFMVKFEGKIQEFAYNPYFAPLTAADANLRLLPRTHVVSSEYDVLRDDSILLYERMKSLGLQVSHQHFEFGSHGLSNFYGEISYKKLNEEMERMLDILRASLKHC